jgi:hypothetical protein
LKIKNKDISDNRDSKVKEFKCKLDSRLDTNKERTSLLINGTKRFTQNMAHILNFEEF